MLARLKKHRRTKRFALFAACGITAISAIYISPFRLAIVSGPSMNPTLHSGQILLLDRRYAKPGHPVVKGDIVSFNYKGSKFVKRVYGLPGDVIYQLHTSNEPDMIIPAYQLDRIRRSVMARRKDAELVKVVVPEGYVYLLGDGGMISVDSRKFGPQPQSSIIGRLKPFSAVFQPDNQIVASLPVR